MKLRLVCAFELACMRVIYECAKLLARWNTWLARREAARWRSRLATEAHPSARLPRRCVPIAKGPAPARSRAELETNPRWN